MKFMDGAKARLDAWNAQRRAAAEEKRRVRQLAAAQDSHHHSRFWLLNVPALATICAAIVEWYWAVLFCIEATGRLGMDWSTSTGSDAPAAGAWHFLFDIQNVWVLIGLILATMPIVMLSMIWLPVQFAMRGAGRMRRGSLIAVGVLANILVIVSGTVVMNFNRQEQVRADLVIEQTAQQSRAAIDARLAFEQEQLRLALNNSNPYLNQAANVGAAEWERSYVAQARATNDPRLPMLERALGAARAADQRRANIERLTIERAQAAPEAASAAVVQDNVGAELNTFAQYVEVWRPPFVAFICTLIGIFGAWWVLAMLERLNPKDVLRSGWADDSHRIEDLREEEAVTPQPMKPPREVVTDADTGEELVKVKPREYWRRRVTKKGVPTPVDVAPDPQPDETGVAHDGGGRSGSVTVSDAAPVANDESSEQPAEQPNGGVDLPGLVNNENAVDNREHPEPLDLTPEELHALDELAESAPVDTSDAALPLQSGEPEAAPDEASDPAHTDAEHEADHSDLPENEEPAREPEQDPARLIASVAAE